MKVEIEMDIVTVIHIYVVLSMIIYDNVFNVFSAYPLCPLARYHNESDVYPPYTSTIPGHTFSKMAHLCIYEQTSVSYTSIKVFTLVVCPKLKLII